MLNKRNLLPFKLAVLIGFIGGLSSSYGDIRAHDYLRYHLYNTTARLLISDIDRRILLAGFVLYSIWALYMVCRTETAKAVYATIAVCAQSLAGSRLKGSSRRVYRVGGVCAILVILALKLGLWVWLKQFDSLFLQTAIAQSKWQIIFSSGLLIFGVVYVIRIKRSSQKPTPGLDSRLDAGRGSRVSFRDFVRAIRWCILRIERPNALYLCAGLLVLALNAAAMLLWIRAAISVDKKPNIIIIMDDTLRADHVGCYGYSRNTTPNIDRFAVGSTRFSEAISNSSWTTASVASFMTSQYPQSVICRDLVNNDYGGLPTVSSRAVTIAEYLKDQGYSTGAVISNPQYGAARNGSQGFEYFSDCSKVKGSTSPDVFSHARDWIGTRKNKFFLFVLFMDIHSPYRRHTEYDFDPGYSGKCKDEVTVGHSDTVLTAKCGLNHMKALYDSNVAYTDHHIGLLLSELKKRGLYDDSTIIVLADHGEEFADHGGFFHGTTLYHELVHVPLIIKQPNQTRGRVVKGLFPLVDLFPTIIKHIGSDPKDIHPQGTSVDLGRVEEMRDTNVFGATSIYKKLRSVRNRQYSYVFDLTKRKEELFDLRTDPLEQHNIASGERSLANVLNKMLLAKEKEFSVDQKSAAKPDEKVNIREEERKLRSLGYL